MEHCFLRSVLLALLAVAAPAEIVDRIVATVGRRVITLSQVQEAWRVERLLNQQPPQPLDASLVREVADRLLNQALLAQEMEASRFPHVSGSEIEARMAEIRQSYGGEAGFRQALEKHQVEEQALRRRVELEENLNRFIELRFRPIVQVDEPAIERYYRETLLPQLRQRGSSQTPQLDEVRERIEEVLVAQRINGELANWIKELRAQANIQWRL